MGGGEADRRVEVVEAADQGRDGRRGRCRPKPPRISASARGLTSGSGLARSSRALPGEASSGSHSLWTRSVGRPRRRRRRGPFLPCLRPIAAEGSMRAASSSRPIDPSRQAAAWTSGRRGRPGTGPKSARPATCAQAMGQGFADHPADGRIRDRTGRRTTRGRPPGQVGRSSPGLSRRIRDWPRSAPSGPARGPRGRRRTAPSGASSRELGSPGCGH